MARVKSASVGDASLYDKHLVANIKSGLTPVLYCSFPTTALNKALNLITRCCLIMQIQTFLFRQKRYHCFCVLQLNNVQAFVNVLVREFHCESSAVPIEYTSVLESQVSDKYAGVESFSSLDDHQFRDLRPEFFKCRWFGTNERVVNVGYHTCFVRLMHTQTLLQFATFETHVLCEYSSQEFCEISSGCSHAILRTM